MRFVCTMGIISLLLVLAGYGFAGLCFLGLISILSACIRWYPGTTPDRIYSARAGGRALRLYGDREFNQWMEKK